MRIPTRFAQTRRIAPAGRPDGAHQHRPTLHAHLQRLVQGRALAVASHFPRVTAQRCAQVPPEAYGMLWTSRLLSRAPPLLAYGSGRRLRSLRTSFARARMA